MVTGGENHLMFRLLLNRKGSFPRNLFVLLALSISWQVAIGQDGERREIDSLIQSSFEVFNEVASEKKDVNTLKTKQIVVWQALTIMTGTKSGQLSYADIEPFNLGDLKIWKDWYSKNPDIQELIIVVKVLEKIYSGDYNEKYLNFIDKIELKNRGKSDGN